MENPPHPYSGTPPPTHMRAVLISPGSSGLWTPMSRLNSNGLDFTGSDRPHTNTQNTGCSRPVPPSKNICGPREHLAAAHNSPATALRAPHPLALMVRVCAPTSQESIQVLPECPDPRLVRLRTLACSMTSPPSKQNTFLGPHVRPYGLAGRPSLLGTEQEVTALS